MALSVTTSGTVTATSTTERELATATGANVYELLVDLTNMNTVTSTATDGVAISDIIEIREYGRVISSTGTDGLIKTYTMQGIQSEKIFRTVPRISPHYMRYTLTKYANTAGATDRSFKWAIYQVQ